MNATEQENLDFKGFIKEYNEYLIVSLKTHDPMKIGAQRARAIRVGIKLRDDIKRSKIKFASILCKVNDTSQMIMLQRLRSWIVEQEYEFEGKMKQLLKEQDEYNDFMDKMTL